MVGSEFRWYILFLCRDLSQKFCCDWVNYETIFLFCCCNPIPAIILPEYRQRARN